MVSGYTEMSWPGLASFEKAPGISGCVAAAKKNSFQLFPHLFLYLDWDFWGWWWKPSPKILESRNGHSRQLSCLKASLKPKTTKDLFWRIICILTFSLFLTSFSSHQPISLSFSSFFLLKDLLPFLDLFSFPGSFPSAGSFSFCWITFLPQVPFPSSV